MQRNSSAPREPRKREATVRQRRSVGTGNRALEGGEAGGHNHLQHQGEAAGYASIRRLGSDVDSTTTAIRCQYKFFGLLVSGNIFMVQNVISTPDQLCTGSARLVGGREDGPKPGGILIPSRRHIRLRRDPGHADARNTQKPLKRPDHDCNPQIQGAGPR